MAFRSHSFDRLTRATEKLFRSPPLFLPNQALMGGTRADAPAVGERRILGSFRRVVPRLRQLISAERPAAQDFDIILVAENTVRDRPGGKESVASRDRRQDFDRGNR